MGVAKYALFTDIETPGSSSARKSAGVTATSSVDLIKNRLKRDVTDALALAPRKWKDGRTFTLFRQHTGAASLSPNSIHLGDSLWDDTLPFMVESVQTDKSGSTGYRLSRANKEKLLEEIQNVSPTAVDGNGRVWYMRVSKWDDSQSPVRKLVRSHHGDHAGGDSTELEENLKIGVLEEMVKDQKSDYFLKTKPQRTAFAGASLYALDVADKTHTRRSLKEIEGAISIEVAGLPIVLETEQDISVDTVLCQAAIVPDTKGKPQVPDPSATRHMIDHRQTSPHGNYTAGLKTATALATDHDTVEMSSLPVIQAKSSDTSTAFKKDLMPKSVTFPAPTITEHSATAAMFRPCYSLIIGTHGSHPVSYFWTDDQVKSTVEYLFRDRLTIWSKESQALLSYGNQGPYSFETPVIDLRPKFLGQPEYTVSVGEKYLTPGTSQYRTAIYHMSEDHLRGAVSEMLWSRKHSAATRHIDWIKIFRQTAEVDLVTQKRVYEAASRVELSLLNDRRLDVTLLWGMVRSQLKLQEGLMGEIRKAKQEKEAAMNELISEMEELERLESGDFRQRLLGCTSRRLDRHITSWAGSPHVTLGSRFG